MLRSLFDLQNGATGKRNRSGDEQVDKEMSTPPTPPGAIATYFENSTGGGDTGGAPFFPMRDDLILHAPKRVKEYDGEIALPEPSIPPYLARVEDQTAELGSHLPVVSPPPFPPPTTSIRAEVVKNPVVIAHPHACTFCDVAYRTLSLLAEHLRRRHSSAWKTTMGIEELEHCSCGVLYASGASIASHRRSCRAVTRKLGPHDGCVCAGCTGQTPLPGTVSAEEKTKNVEKVSAPTVPHRDDFGFVANDWEEV